MIDIDKILEDVEWREANRPHGYLDRIPTEEEGRSMALASEVRRLRADNERLRLACSKANDEISQTLGKALGYPWFKDDRKNFPGATEANGVCVGDHVAESLADEAAKRIHAIGLAVAEYFAADEIVTREIDNAEPDEPDHGELVEAMYRLTVATTTLKNLTMIGGIK